MAELERELHCENCGSQCRIIYDSDQVHYDPETCPFCGEIAGTVVDEDWDELDDDGLGDDDGNDLNWN
jgi:hypothetical protein